MAGRITDDPRQGTCATRSKARLVLVAILGVATLVGCQPASIVSAPGQPPMAAISVPDLAARLGLDVGQSTGHFALLRDRANTVTIYSDPSGQAYVNGVAVGARGGISSAGGAIYVPASLEPEIRQSLRSAQQGPLSGAVNPRQPRLKPAKVSRPAPTSPPAPASNRPAGRVMIDAGHGGKDPGAISVLRTQEKTITLAVAKAVARELRACGVDVILSRTDDTYTSPDERAELANRSKVDLFVSIHADSLPSKPQEYGFAAWISPTASSQSVSAAGAISRRMAAAGFHDRGIKRNVFRVLVVTTCPAVLVEMGFLSNRADAARLVDPAEQARYARAIAAGIVDYLDRR